MQSLSRLSHVSTAIDASTRLPSALVRAMSSIAEIDAAVPPAAAILSASAGEALSKWTTCVLMLHAMRPFDDGASRLAIMRRP